MIRSTRLIRVVLLGGLTVATLTGTARAAETVAPRCALLEDVTEGPSSPVVPLLEARLLAGDGVTLLERDAIAAILREQKVQSLFGPEAGRQRAAAGALLKADLLILLRAVREGPPSLDVTISETRRGLRLCAQAVPLTQDPDADAATVERLVRGAMRKYEERITQVCAVPPFLSNDLTFEFDHLKAAYARSIEQMLLARKGLLVVELAEARAIAREVVLSGSSGGVERMSPLYLLGEFRHEGGRASPRVTIGLVLKRGEERLGEVRRADLPPVEAPPFLRRATAELIGKVDAQAEPPADPMAEATQLAGRARDFERLGNWAEAVALMEASLLLDPDQPALHRKATEALKMLADQWLGTFTSTDDPGKARLRAGLFRRGLEHAEPYLRAARLGPTELWHIPAPPYYGFHTESNVKPGPLDAEILLEERAMLLRVLRARIDGGISDNFIPTFTRNMPWKIGAETKRDALDLALRIIRDYEHRPGTGGWTYRIGLSVVTSVRLDVPETLAFLDRLAASPSLAIRREAEDIKRTRLEGSRLLAREAEKSARASEVPTAPAPPLASLAGSTRTVVCRPLTFSTEDADGKQGAAHQILGCLPAGDGVDVVWSPRDIYVMKEKGKLSRVFSYDTGFIQFDEPCYDGRFAWVPARSVVDPPFLVVIDPVGERAWKITTADGLPFASQSELPPHTAQFLNVAPIGPGRICAVGAFGRTWLAIVAFDPGGRKSVEVFHEAREVAPEPPPNDPTPDDLWKSTALAFRPRYMVTLTGPRADGAGPARRILLGRSARHYQPASSHPLLIDPDTKTVQVVNENVDVYQGKPFDVHRGEFYWNEEPHVMRRDPSPKRNLYRLGLPDLVKRPVLRDLLEEGRVASLGDRIAVLGTRWMESDLSGEGAAPPATSVPWYFLRASGDRPSTEVIRRGHLSVTGVHRSHHYGLLITITEPNPPRESLHNIYKVDFRGPPPIQGRRDEE